MPKMPLPPHPDKVKNLDDVKPKLLAASEPKVLPNSESVEGGVFSALGRQLLCPLRSAAFEAAARARLLNGRIQRGLN
jgi:hypothetical protein